jgi:hypothetical protein
MRARIRDRFAQLHSERTQAETELTNLERAIPMAANPAILDEIPYADDVPPRPARHPKSPPVCRLRPSHPVWNKPDNQTTIIIEITGITLQALPSILGPGQDGHDTALADSALI